MVSDEICPLTKAKARAQNHYSDGYRFYNSELCGPYALANEIERRVRFDRFNSTQGLINCAKRSIEVHEESADQFAYWVDRPLYEKISKGEIKTTPDMVPVVFDDFYEQDVDHASKPYLLLESLAQRLSRNRAFMIVPISPRDMLSARICDIDELETHVDFLTSPQRHYMVRENVIVDVLREPTDFHVGITVDGWGEVRRRNQGIQSNRAFVAMQFDWNNFGDLRLKTLEAIKLACEDCGYVASTVSQDHTGSITDRIIAEIRRSRFVIAELTYNNRGVYFEAGYARGLGVPVFHVVNLDHVGGQDSEGKRIHFDIAQVQYRKWETPESLREQLRDWIQVVVGKYQ